MPRNDNSWSFAELAIEAMYQISKEAGIKAGYLLSREQWWMTPGALIVFPMGYYQLMKAGVTDIGLAQQFRFPETKQLLWETNHRS